MRTASVRLAVLHLPAVGAAAPPSPVLPAEMKVTYLTSLHYVPPQQLSATWWRDAPRRRERLDQETTTGGTAHTLTLANCSYSYGLDAGRPECIVNGGGFGDGAVPFGDGAVPPGAVYNGTTTVAAANGSSVTADEWYFVSNGTRNSTHPQVDEVVYYYMSPPYAETAPPHHYQHRVLLREFLIDHARQGHPAGDPRLVSEVLWTACEEGAQDPSLFEFPSTCWGVDDPMMKCPADIPTWRCEPAPKPHCVKCAPLECNETFFAKCDFACRNVSAPRE